MLDEVWRDDALHYFGSLTMCGDVWWHDEDEGKLCQTCGVRSQYLRPTNVAFSQFTVHRQVTFVRDGYRRPDDEVLLWEERDVCLGCFDLLYCGAYMDW